MQLIYNGTDLATLGVLRILSHNVVREPAEAPQRERQSFKVRLDFFEQSFSANMGLLTSLRAALKTQNAVLAWTDDAGVQRLNRTVLAAEDEADSTAQEKGGTYWQGITFTFWFYNHDVVTNCLNATAQRAGANTPVLNLGAVTGWSERLTSARFDDFRDTRKRTGGTVSASGRYQADTTQPLAQRRSALLALKDQMMAELAAAANATLIFGTFNQAVRVDGFTADVDQPANFIEWKLEVSFTRYPDEADYSVLEYDLTPHENLAEGIQYLTLAGKIQSPNEAAARARLAALQTSVISAGYILLDVKTDAKTVGSESDNAGDGMVFTELTFTVEYRDPATLSATYTVAGGPTFTLGTIDKFRDSYASARFDEMRDVRKRTAGNITVGGKWYVPDALTAAQQQAALTAQKVLMDAQILGGSSGTLAYAPIFTGKVRITEFNCEINRLTNCIEWTLAATFTRYPNEADYALLEYTVAPRESLPEGINYLTLAGKVQSPTEAAARSRLAALQTSVIPAGYVLLDVKTDARTVGSETTGGTGDGVTFIELSFSVEYRDPATLPATYTVTGGSTFTLGTIDKFRDSYATARFDELRDVRKRTAGNITVGGKWYVSDALTPAQQQAALTAQKVLMDAQILGGSAGVLTYAPIFTGKVRITEFNCEINRLTNCIEWTLAATFTRYPNETDYALLEYTVAPRESLPEGINYLTLAGKVQSPTEAAARSRLAALQTSVIPAGYVLLDVKTDARTVGSEAPSGAGNGDGITFIELSFSVEYRDPATLPSTYQVTGGSAFTLGTIDKFRDSYATARFDELRDVRKRTAGNITVGGKWYASPTLSAAAMQAALIAQKGLMDAQILGGSSGTLTYAGIFSGKVRITEFNCEINRLTNCIEWTLAATFTRYPNEADYALIEFNASPRLSQSDGINYLTLSGKIQSPSEAAARARLALLQASVIPSSYVTLDVKTDAKTLGSETTGGTGDGLTFIELTFTVEYRDPAGITTTYQRAVSNAPVANLGTVDKFSNRFAVTLFDDLRSNRKRAAGTCSLSGKWYAADTLNAAGKQSALLAQLALFQSEMINGSSGVLNYAGVLNQTVRLTDWDAHINRVNNVNCIEWSLTATYTAYPNESDYALCEFGLETRQNLADGTVIKTMTGRIGAPTPEAAQSKLARLRTSLIPAGYTLLHDGTTEKRVDVESGRAGGTDTGDGYTFIELGINDEWQLTAGSVLTWSLRTTTAVDSKTGWTVTTYGGTVAAVAATQPLAFAAAAAQAAALGAGKFPFLIRSSVTSVDKLFQTPVAVGSQTVTAQVFVTVEFSYEYQTRGVNTFIEVMSELNTDSFGITTETVSGTINAPTLALATASYLVNVRNVAAFNGSLILSERTPTVSQQQLYDSGPALLSALDDRFAFSLQVFRPKGATQSSISYTAVPDSNLQTNETTTTVSGTVWASSQVVAEALLQTVLTTVAPGGKLVRSQRTPQLKRGPVVGGGATSADIFESMGFSVVYVSALTGAAGILESEVTEDLIYSGTRQIEKPIPDGVSIIQQAGTTCGRRTVTARCVSTTPTAAQAWVRTIRAALLQSVSDPANAFENPPQVRTGYQFLPQIAGVPVGGSANVKLFEVNATFSELIPELVFTP